MILANADIVAEAEGWAREALRPPEEMMPDEFVRRYRFTHQVYCTESYGKWDEDKFPWQKRAINCVREAIDSGKRGVCEMKAGQVGGTEFGINGQTYCKQYLPGPQLFMTSTDGVAREFSRERFALIIPDMEPLAEKYIPNARGDGMVHRFVDGKIHICGGQSIFKLQSTPYRVVVIDELDSLVANLGGEGDPLSLAEIRTDSFEGQTLMIVYAHPTTIKQGVARVYFDLSDQRRGFVRHSCGGEFYLQWEHVKARPAPGQKQEEAESDPDCWHYFCPKCNAMITDSERTALLRGTLQYRSVLPAEVAKKRTWIGIHVSQLYTPAKTIRFLAERWIECGRDENKIRVFMNKRMGEPYEVKTKKLSLEGFRKLISAKSRPNDPEFYTRGQVPPWVRYLTAGQDSREAEFHHAIWGWGRRRDTKGILHICGALIDWGNIKRLTSPMFDQAEYHEAFDERIYRKRFPSSTILDKWFHVVHGGHDIAYKPTILPIVTYCGYFPNRAFPVRGASLTHSSAITADYYVKWGNQVRYRIGEEEVAEEVRHLMVNTFVIKCEWYNCVNPDRRIEIHDKSDGEIVGTRKVWRICFPGAAEAADERDRLELEEMLEQCKNEFQAPGQKEGELVWKHSGPNHYADCNTYAMAMAHQAKAFAEDRPVDEMPAEAARRRPAAPRAAGGQGHDPSLG